MLFVSISDQNGIRVNRKGMGRTCIVLYLLGLVFECRSFGWVAISTLLASIYKRRVSIQRISMQSRAGTKEIHKPASKKKHRRLELKTFQEWIPNPSPGMKLKYAPNPKTIRETPTGAKIDPNETCERLKPSLSMM